MSESISTDFRIQKGVRTYKELEKAERRSETEKLITCLHALIATDRFAEFFVHILEFLLEVLTT